MKTRATNRGRGVAEVNPNGHKHSPFLDASVRETPYKQGSRRLGLRIGADGEEKVAAQLGKVAKKDPRWRFIHAIPVATEDPTSTT